LDLLIRAGAVCCAFVQMASRGGLNGECPDSGAASGGEGKAADYMMNSFSLRTIGCCISCRSFLTWFSP
jgi:hypothetical protein